MTLGSMLSTNRILVSEESCLAILKYCILTLSFCGFNRQTKKKENRILQSSIIFNYSFHDNIVGCEFVCREFVRVYFFKLTLFRAFSLSVWFLCYLISGSLERVFEGSVNFMKIL